MSVQEMNEVRELAAAELDAVSGGGPSLVRPVRAAPAVAPFSIRSWQGPTTSQTSAPSFGVGVGAYPT
jgi:hypothetical protein